MQGKEDIDKAAKTHTFLVLKCMARHLQGLIEGKRNTLFLVEAEQQKPTKHQKRTTATPKIQMTRR